MPRKKASSKKAGNRKAANNANASTDLRIIGGKFRGSKLAYSGDPRTRPMKERVREATFNLVGPAAKGKHAIDLFAGTGALGLEAISRGANKATFWERHFPTAKLIEQNATALNLQDATTIVAGDTFCWFQLQEEWKAWNDLPWLVFCSPPYVLYVDEQQAMLQLLQSLYQHAPAGSLFVVEADQRFDFQLLNDLGPWDVRQYPPATIGVTETE